MSWEEPTEPRRRWRTFTGVVVAVLLVAVGAAALTGSDEPTALLPVTQVDDPLVTDGANTGPQFETARIDPVETSRSVNGSGPLLPGGPPLTVVAADFASRLQFVDIASGDVRSVRLFADAGRGRPHTLEVVGDSVILNTDGGTVVRLANGEERALVLARNHRLITTADPTSVWVYDGLATGVGGAATRIGFDDTLHETVGLPALAYPLAGTADGLLVGAAGTISWIDGDGSHRAVARGQALASDGDRLARLDCTDDLSCAVVAGTVDDPDQMRAALRPDDVPAGLYDVPHGRFSPDGRWLALPVYRARRTGAVESTSVVVFDLALGAEAFRTEGSALTAPATPLGWSPDSGYLVVSTGTRLLAWSTTTFQVTELDVRVSPTYALVVR